MTMTFNPDDAANDKKKTDTFNPLAQFESMKFDTAFPEAMRAFAGTAVTQSREAYERAKATLDANLHAIERSYDAAGQAATALNRKIIDIAQRNVNSGFDLAKSLASAKNLAEIVELQGAFWRKQIERSWSRPKRSASSRSMPAPRLPSRSSGMRPSRPSRFTPCRSR